MHQHTNMSRRTTRQEPIKVVTSEAPELPCSQRHARYTATQGAVPSENTTF